MKGDKLGRQVRSGNGDQAAISEISDPVIEK